MKKIKSKNKTIINKTSSYYVGYLFGVLSLYFTVQTENLMAGIAFLILGMIITWN